MLPSNVWQIAILHAQPMPVNYVNCLLWRVSFVAVLHVQQLKALPT